MPLTSCSVDGKSGFRWGHQGKCYTGPGAKKKALKQGIAEEGPKKFRDILQKDKASIGDRQTQLLAQAVYNEMFPRGAADEFLHSIASFFAVAEDGDNDSDKDVGDKGKVDLDDTTDVRDGEFANSGKDDREFGPDGKYENPPARKQVNNGEVVKSDDVNDDNETLATTELPPELSYGESTLDDHRDDVGLNSVVPKYDEEASPETKPGVPALQCDPPTREETTPKANVYSGDDEDAAEAQMDEENTSEADAKDGDGEDPERELAALAEYVEFAFGFISTEVRNHLPDEDFAGPHKSFPIRNSEDIRHAATLLHHAHNPSEVKRNIVRIAKKKGFKLPATWSHEADACTY